MVGIVSSSEGCLGVCSQHVFMDVWLCFILGLLSDRVPPLQAVTAVCARHGSGGHAAAAGLVRSVCGFRQHDETNNHCSLFFICQYKAV